MNAILTVIGRDRVGIIAAVSQQLKDLNINILDISQTLIGGSFTMVMSVDMAGCTLSFAEVKEALNALGSSMELSIRIQRSEIFEAMHTI